MYPTEVKVNEQNIEKLTRLMKDSYKEIVQEIKTSTSFGIANRRALLKQIEKILEGLGEDITTFIEDELPGYYRDGADEAVTQLRHVGAEVNIAEGFNRIHKEAVLALVDDAQRAFGESLTGVGRSANLLLGRAVRETLSQEMAKGTLKGESLREVRKTIITTLEDQGLSALIDKSGRTWTLDRYADMLIRTKAVEARNRGFMNRMVENGFDLVQVSTHYSNHRECQVWEGKILSLTGKTEGYQTVAFAESKGLFHPNCKHAINGAIPSLSTLTRSYADKPTLTREDAMRLASDSQKDHFSFVK